MQKDLSLISTVRTDGRKEDRNRGKEEGRGEGESRREGRKGGVGLPYCPIFRSRSLNHKKV